MRTKIDELKQRTATTIATATELMIAKYFGLVDCFSSSSSLLSTDDMID
jgi:hypothetical protein